MINIEIHGWDGHDESSLATRGILAYEICRMVSDAPYKPEVVITQVPDSSCELKAGESYFFFRVFSTSPDISDLVSRLSRLNTNIEHVVLTGFYPVTTKATPS